MADHNIIVHTFSAVADLFGGVGPFCAIARHIIKTTSALNVVCFVEIFLNLLAAYGNVYCILLVTIDRWIYISRPLRYVLLLLPALFVISISKSMDR